MGELSFEYKAYTKHKLVQSFKYWYEKTIKYGFIYQRFTSLYDTSMFNSPVVITKVATGLSNIIWDNIFVSVDSNNISKKNVSGIYISKDSKSFIPNDTYFKSLFIKRINKSFIPKISLGLVSKDGHSFIITSNYVSVSKDKNNLIILYK